MKAQYDSEGDYEIRLENGQTQRWLRVRPTGKIISDDLY
jgi:hypothetical protein